MLQKTEGDCPLRNANTGVLCRIQVWHLVCVQRLPELLHLLCAYCRSNRRGGYHWYQCFNGPVDTGR